jgi:hypothetical protein
MIQGIAPLLDDPITSTFRFGLVAVGTAGNGEIRPPYQYARMISNFVPADEFLDILEAARMIQSAGKNQLLIQCSGQWNYIHFLGDQTHKK